MMWLLMFDVVQGDAAAVFFTCRWFWDGPSRDLVLRFAVPEVGLMGRSRLSRISITLQTPGQTVERHAVPGHLPALLRSDDHAHLRGVHVRVLPLE